MLQFVTAVFLFNLIFFLLILLVKKHIPLSTAVLVLTSVVSFVCSASFPYLAAAMPFPKEIVTFLVIILACSIVLEVLQQRMPVPTSPADIQKDNAIKTQKGAEMQGQTETDQFAHAEPPEMELSESTTTPTEAKVDPVEPVIPETGEEPEQGFNLLPQAGHGQSSSETEEENLPEIIESKAAAGSIETWPGAELILDCDEPELVESLEKTGANAAELIPSPVTEDTAALPQTETESATIEPEDKPELIEAIDNHDETVNEFVEASDNSEETVNENLVKLTVAGDEQESAGLEFEPKLVDANYEPELTDTDEYIAIEEEYLPELAGDTILPVNPEHIMEQYLEPDIKSIPAPADTGSDIRQLINTGFSYKQTGHYVRAITNFNAALRLQPPAELEMLILIEISDIYKMVDQPWQAAELLKIMLDKWHTKLNNETIQKLKEKISCLQKAA